MSENDSAIGDDEDTFNVNDIEFDFDKVDDEEDIEDAPIEKEEVVAPIEDERIARLQAELEGARAEVAQAAIDREEAWAEADNNRTMAINTAIHQWQSELDRENRDVLELQKQYNRATSEQDVDTQNDLMDKYNARQQAITQLTNKLNQANAELGNKPVRQAKQSKAEVKSKTSSEQMADKWVVENSWYNDPAHKAKRDFVNKLCNENAKEYDTSTLKFWNFIDKEVEKFSTKSNARRTPPAVRPIANQGAVKSISNSNKKADADIEATTRQFMKASGYTLENTDREQYTARYKSYYDTIRRDVMRSKKNG